MAKILVVDDEKKMVTLLVSALEARGHEATGLTRGQEALDLASSRSFDVVLTDLKMEPVDGMAVIRGIKDIDPATEAIVLTAFGDVNTAVEAMQEGAYDYLTKPFNFQEVVQVVENAAQKHDLVRENRNLKQALAASRPSPKMIGIAAATEQLRQLIAKVAPSEATVLIRGESGTGKEVAARAIHEASGRAAGPFIAVNCAALAESLLESELFGYRKGAFTGADTDRDGLFESARGGTLFLDEIGEAGPGVQAKLLRVLEERKFNRVGDPQEREADVRVIAATNRPLEKAIADHTFREDLYFRLLVFPLDVPALRDRLDDLPLLVDHFLKTMGRPATRVSTQTLTRLRGHGWPGNVREVRNLIERAHILAGVNPVGDEHFLLDVSTQGSDRVPAAGGRQPDLNLDNQARHLIREALQQAQGNKSQAADLLGITRRTLYSRLKVLGMEEEL